MITDFTVIRWFCNEKEVRNVQNKWLRLPLVLIPQLPLIWIVGYWVVAVILQGCGLIIARPTGEQVELALMLAVVWIVASAFNQVLIYQNVPATGVNQYKALAMGNALALICTIVLAWGKPAVILFPRRLSGFMVLMLILTLTIAVLGDYFITVTRPRDGRLPLWLGIGTLVLAAGAAPLFFTHPRDWGCLLAVILVALIQAGYFWQLPRLLVTVPARRSGLYNLVIGIVLAALFTSLLLGVASCYQLLFRDIVGRLSICWGLSWLTLGSGGIVVAAYQRCGGDFRYGHAVDHENWFVAAGSLCWVVALVGLIILI